MGTYYVIMGKMPCRHLTEGEAAEIVGNIFYTDKDGNEHHGGHWNVEQVEVLTKGMSFADCVTKWDKYVALNAMYADLCKILVAEQQIVAAAHAFFFADEDAPCDKIGRYVRAMR